MELLPFLNVRDLKSFRQCSKSLAEEGARLLFRTLTVFLRRDSFDHLRQISDHRDLRLHVRKLCYVASRYLPGLSMDQWRHYYGQGQRDQLNAMVWLQKPYKAYNELADEQEVSVLSIRSKLPLTLQKLLSSAGHIRTWHHALQRLPNLKDFRVLMREARKPNHGLLGPTMSRTFVEPDIETDFRYIFPALPTLSEWTDSCMPAPSLQEHLPILHTLHLEGLNLRRFIDLTSSHQARAACGAPFTFLCGVRDLRVDLVSAKTPDSLYQTGALTLALRNTLIAAKNIVKLRVSWLRLGRQPWCIHIFPNEHTWPDLRYVELHGIGSKANELADFIRRQRASLRRLIVSECSLSEAAADIAAALQNDAETSELDPLNSLSQAFASAAIQRHVEDGRNIFTASWD